MKKWSLQEAKKYLAAIVDDVLHGDVQAIVKSNGEVVYLIPGEKSLPTKDATDLLHHQEKISPNIRSQ
ncbi:MAG: type II toxin-antitoxin system prevent-host-death family antitoxin [Candidatus Midichloria sp.]|uniref:Phd_YefM n=1 Tax=Hyalomma marginatum TaxID=34627 RepID=A0A8S4C1M4_9ACAR|nr:Phd_YefM [Hyalomma marginatum]